MRYATCHPDRKYVAAGLCASCYEQANRRKNGRSGSDWGKANPDLFKEARKRWLLKNTEKTKAYERVRLLRRYYNMTVAEYEALLDAQEGRCAICGGQNISG